MSIPASLVRNVLKKIVPGSADRKAEDQMVRSLLRKIKGMKGPHLGAVLAGSLARNTHLRGDRDLDIFVFYAPTLAREKFETAGLKLGHALFGDSFHEEAYSEHPYVRGTLDGFNVEIVPTYKVLKAVDKLSAVDRTPFHAAYMRKHLSEKQCNQVRLLKQFFKGIRVYGADVHYQGVPGYLVEILILNYGTFEKALQAMAVWRDQTIIDVEKSYASEKEALFHFKHPFFLVVDPTDPSRNVAGALSYNQFARAILAARTFLKKPALHFFFGRTALTLTSAQVKKYLSAEELVGFQLPYPNDMLEDVAWGQLHRLTTKFAHALEQHSFQIRRTFAWTDGHSPIILLFDVENPLLPRAHTRLGPKVVEANHAAQFLKAHPAPLSGPRVEQGRVVLEVSRAIWKIEDALARELNKCAQTEKGALQHSLHSAALLRESHLLPLMKQNPSFARELSVFLKGREPFL